MYDRREADKRYRERHRDECNSRTKTYKKEHPEKTKEQGAKYRRTHQEVITEYNAQYRATLCNDLRLALCGAFKRLTLGPRLSAQTYGSGRRGGCEEISRLSGLGLEQGGATTLPARP